MIMDATIKRVLGGYIIAQDFSYDNCTPTVVAKIGEENEILNHLFGHIFENELSNYGDMISIELVIKNLELGDGDETCKYIQDSFEDGLELTEFSKKGANND